MLVSQDKPSFEDAYNIHNVRDMCVYIYIYIYTIFMYIVSKSEEILGKSVKHPSKKVEHEPTADSMDGATMLEKMVMFLQYSVQPNYATCFSQSIAILQQECNIVLKKGVLGVQPRTRQR